MRRITKALSMLHFLPDAAYLKAAFFLETGEFLDLENPRGFNEKLQWLKLFGYRREHRSLVFKVTAREIAEGAVGEAHLPKEIMVGEWASDIDFGKLPSPCIVKCAHGSHCGFVWDRGKMTPLGMRARLMRYSLRDWFWYGREKGYRRLPPVVIFEEYLPNVTDVKVMCFSGVPRFIQVHRDGKIGFFDMDGAKNPWAKDGYGSDIRFPNDLNISELQTLTEKLLRAIPGGCPPYIRIDFMLSLGQLYFGEYTLYDSSGFKGFSGNADRILGAMIPIDSLTCPKCLSQMSYNVSGDERHDACGCGYTRVRKIKEALDGSF